MKIFYVWTHCEVTPWEVEAKTRKDALAKGLELAKENPPILPGGYFGCEHGESDGPAFMQSRQADPLTEPYARVKPKPSAWHRR